MNPIPVALTKCTAKHVITPNSFVLLFGIFASLWAFSLLQFMCVTCQ